jgi:hypothetical protein
LPARQFLQAQRDSQRLLPLILEDELLKLDDDGLLSGISFGGLFRRRRGVGGGARLLEEADDLLHVLFAEPIDHGANGTQNLDVFARDAIAVELRDDRFKLIADLLGRGFDLLLLEFLGEDGRLQSSWCIGPVSRSRDPGARLTKQRQNSFHSSADCKHRNTAPGQDKAATSDWFEFFRAVEAWEASQDLAGSPASQPLVDHRPRTVGAGRASARFNVNRANRTETVPGDAIVGGRS